MTLDLALVLRGSEAALALVLLQQCAEHLLPGAGARTSRLGTPSAALLAALRVPLALLLLLGLQPLPALAGLAVLALASLLRFDGPYNGGSDRLGMLMLACLLVARLFADGRSTDDIVPRMALGYLGLQLVASYFLAGWVKLVNPAWRSGEALRDVFALSAYPVSESLRGWARWPRLLRAMGWGVILLELAFPLALLDARLLWAALSLTTLFHLANALLFGLNRFLWTWLAAYPALLWFQQQLPWS